MRNFRNSYKENFSMESKLPKPSGLKKPMTFTKSVLPTDRIKPINNTGFGQLHRIGENVAWNNLTSFTLPNDIRRRDRAGSPDVARAFGPTRAKLRRSRSACDIHDMRPLKRAEQNLAAKKFLAYTSAAASSQTNSSLTASKPSRIGAMTTAAPKRPPLPAIKNSSMGRLQTMSGTAPKKTSTASTTSSTGAVKIVKRIPPYDFKARYNDLLEKHKLLKEKYEDNREQMESFESLPEQLEQSQSQLLIATDELRNANIEIDSLQRQVKSQTIKIDSITKCLQQTKEELEILKEKYKDLSEQHSAITAEVIELRQRSSNLEEENFQMQEELVTCREQVFRSNMERKELHNAVMDLRGNIRVFCRVRPVLESEQDKLVCSWSYLDEATLEVQNLELAGVKNKLPTHVFSFDHVFHPRSSQEDIFGMVSPLIQSALDGYNICIFAYGQTGSGKTYTMDGIPSALGVIPRTVDLLFDSIEQYKHFGWKYEINVSFLEIYNEVLYDLLSNEHKEMEIRMSKNNKNNIYVSNITRETVTNAGRLRQLMQIAKMNRATAATVSNERSSRSHAVTKIELMGFHAEKNEVSMGSINLVDLAGSESPKTSTRMNETKNINRSLSELTNVILALLQKQDHIPYRNSKLTHLLMPSLGGNSKTLMFINVAPLQDCFVESVKSLRFAANVNSCKMSKAKRNKFLNTSSNSNSLL